MTDLQGGGLEGSQPVDLFKHPSGIVPTLHLILYAACLEGSDPVRLFENRINARREPGYDFDKESLLEYNHMSFGGPPVTANALPEADELLLHDQKESEIDNEPAGRILELSILHLAMSEIAVLGTRHQIVINEAVDVAKRFCHGAAPCIINGCLRTFVKDLKGTSAVEGRS